MLHDFLISVDLWHGVHLRLNRSSLGGDRPGIPVPFLVSFPWRSTSVGQQQQQQLFNYFNWKEKAQITTHLLGRASGLPARMVGRNSN